MTVITSLFKKIENINDILYGRFVDDNDKKQSF